MSVHIIEGNLLEQKVQAIVNPWNRNFIPWWLLLPHGVSGAIRKTAGVKPFQEVSKKGLLKTGEAVWTSAGKLDFKGIIHVAGINQFWVSTEKSIILSVRNALELATEKDLQTIALPLIDSGVGGRDPQEVLTLIEDEAKQSKFLGESIIVKYKK